MIKNKRTTSTDLNLIMQRLPQAKLAALKLLGRHPNNTPEFIVSPHTIKSQGVLSKRIENIFVEHGFNSGAFFNHAFYSFLSDVIQTLPKKRVVIATTRSRFGKTKETKLDSLEAAECLFNKINYVKIKLASLPLG